jgi:hypothetical protein
MVARVWHGFASTSNASRHAAYLQQKLLPTYLGLQGNRGAMLLVACLEALTGGPVIEEAVPV